MAAAPLEPTVPFYCHPLPSNQCTTKHNPSHPGACALLAVSHICTHRQRSRRQRLSNLNRTSAFVYGSLDYHRCVSASPIEAEAQRGATSGLHPPQIFAYQERADVRPGEIYRLGSGGKASGSCLGTGCNHQRAARKHGTATTINCWLMVDT